MSLGGYRCNWDTNLAKSPRKSESLPASAHADLTQATKTPTSKGGVVHRIIIPMLWIVVVGCGVGEMPRAAADNPFCKQYDCWFVSPSGNIFCQIEFQSPAASGPDSAICNIVSLRESGSLDASGEVYICPYENAVGIRKMSRSCEGNPPPGAPTLAYGQSVTLGPYTCLSEVSGITCTVPSGRGFTASRSGISQVG